MPKAQVYVCDPVTGETVAWDGVITASETAVADTPEFFEDTDFVTGDSPVTLDINTALGRNATTATIWNDGAGDFTYSLSTDGATFGDNIRLKASDRAHIITGLSIDSIRITWVADSSYRVTAV
jgi:hypothetical protein